MAQRFGTVVVLGGSFGGMLAAAVASRHADRVILVERDALDGLARKGVPQGRHNHNLLARGREIADRFAPGFDRELRARGASAIDSGGRARWSIRGHRLARVESGHTSIFATRPAIDAALLACLRDLGNVEIRDRTDVLGLLVQGDRVSGVRASARGDDSGERAIEGDLVIDATGRGSRTPKWLEELGRAMPPNDELEVRVGYATRTFRRRESDLGGDLAIFVSSVPPHQARGGVVFAVEGERWMVLLFEYAGGKPPLDLDGFRAFASSLGAPDFAELVSRAEPLDDGVPFAYPRAVRRRYDRTRMPEGLLVFGDAIVSTNPSWGAGMTSAALQAEALDRAFAEGTLGRWHAAAIAASSEVWESTTGNDRAFDCISGQPHWIERAINTYVNAVCDAAQHDPILARAMIRVIDRVASPPSILRPDLALRVLAHRARPRAALSRMLEA
jgi:2-polyprenyl-6-methoxyphenol hydroxylase-like FAD-dependent oxidoreductase